LAIDAQINIVDYNKVTLVVMSNLEQPCCQFLRYILHYLGVNCQISTLTVIQALFLAKIDYTNTSTRRFVLEIDSKAAQDQT
jgi:hypothetical protein